jgi:hypothetical protein
MVVTLPNDDVVETGPWGTARTTQTANTFYDIALWTSTRVI